MATRKPKRRREPARLDPQAGDLTGQAQAIARELTELEDRARRIAGILVSIEWGRKFALVVSNKRGEETRVEIDPVDRESREYFLAALLVELGELRDEARLSDLCRAIRPYSERFRDDLQLDIEISQEARERSLRGVTNPSNLGKKIKRAGQMQAAARESIGRLSRDRELTELQEERATRRSRSEAARKEPSGGDRTHVDNDEM